MLAGEDVAENDGASPERWVIGRFGVDPAARVLRADEKRSGAPQRLQVHFVSVIAGNLSAVHVVRTDVGFGTPSELEDAFISADVPQSDAEMDVIRTLLGV